MGLVELIIVLLVVLWIVSAGITLYNILVGLLVAVVAIFVLRLVLANRPPRI